MDGKSKRRTISAWTKYGIRNHKEEKMPHVIVKLWLGKSEQQKQRLAEAIDPQGWEKDVYKPDIHDKWQTLYKKPGYSY
jgi:4-oxalocrotonate tautomerase